MYIWKTHSVRTFKTRLQHLSESTPSLDMNSLHTVLRWIPLPLSSKLWPHLFNYQHGKCITIGFVVEDAWFFFLSFFFRVKSRWIYNVVIPSVVNLFSRLWPRIRISILMSYRLSPLFTIPNLRCLRNIKLINYSPRLPHNSLINKKKGLP